MGTWGDHTDIHNTFGGAPRKRVCSNRARDQQAGETPQLSNRTNWRHGAAPAARRLVRNRGSELPPRVLCVPNRYRRRGLASVGRRQRRRPGIPQWHFGRLLSADYLTALLVTGPVHSPPCALDPALLHWQLL